jgi:hypothetical protein
MIETGDGACFLIEAIEKAGFVDEVRGQDLDGDVAIKFLLIRLVNLDVAPRATRDSMRY